MLDEPSLGLAPLLVKEIFEIIADDQPEGHDRAAGGAERLRRPQGRPLRLCAGSGRIVLQGTGEQLIADDRVRSAYLGG